MARVAIVMPAIGSGSELCKVARWLKSTGDTVGRGEAIAEIETDKTTLEMEATLDGTLVEIVHGAGEEVSAGDPIAYVETGTPDD